MSTGFGMGINFIVIDFAITIVDSEVVTVIIVAVKASVAVDNIVTVVTAITMIVD